MEPHIIYSENPKEDIWRRLLNFTFDDNLRTRTNFSTNQPLSPDACADVAASIRQAHEYFSAASGATLCTSPVHLYYGTISLMRALTTLTTGDVISIVNHGMKLDEPEPPEFIDQAVKILGSPGGALLEFARVFGTNGSLAGGKIWPIRDILGMLPDLTTSVHLCTNTKQSVRCIPIERLITPEGDTCDRIDLGSSPNAVALLDNVSGLNARYLHPQQTGDNYIVLRPRLNPSQDITRSDVAGNLFLLAAPKPLAADVPEECLLLLMALYALSIFCRYRPSKWQRFTNSTSAVERQLIEELLLTVSRKTPNFALSYLERKPLVFSNLRYTPVDQRRFATQREITDLVEKTVARTIFESLKGN